MTAVHASGRRATRCLWRWSVLLIGTTVTLLGCIQRPLQPEETQPYALLVFPTAIRLVGLDSQTLDPRERVDTIRVSPGFHRLRMAYTGPSAPHAGQSNDPFCLDTSSGVQYIFDTRTRGIIWRPEITSERPIPGYCTTHSCPPGALQAHSPRQPHGIPCPKPESAP